MAPGKAYSYTYTNTITTTTPRHSTSATGTAQQPLATVSSFASRPFSIEDPIRPHFSPSSAVHSASKQQPSPYRARMSLDIPPPTPTWLSGLRSCLRLLILVLSGAVTVMLVHTMKIYRGNISLDLRKGELPMTWPARTNLAPTLILFCIAASNFFASVAIIALSFKRSFRRPIRSRDMYRIVAGSFGVVLWATALVVFSLLDKASKASLGRYSCTNRNVMSNGRYQYRAVCSEQGVAYYLAIGAASAEVATLLTLAVTAVQSTKRPLPIIQIGEKAPAHFS